MTNRDPAPLIVALILSVAVIVALALYALAAPRPAAQLQPPLAGGATTDRPPAEPSPELGRLAGRPRGDGPPTASLPNATPSPSPTRTRPAATRKPRTARHLRGRLTGTATWFRSPANVSAAGPALRRAIGPGRWRGTRIRVCAGDRCSWTVLGDWCSCLRGDRIVDLDDNVFAALARGELSRGVLRVTVRWPRGE